MNATLSFPFFFASSPSRSIPSACPLLGFVSLVAPAVVRGNTCVVVPSEPHPLAATDLYQVLDTSDLPGGVINVITGNADGMAKTLAEHQDVDALWYLKEDGYRAGLRGVGDVDTREGAIGSYHVEQLAASNMKRTLVSHGRARDWHDPEQGEGHEFLQEASEVKNIWVPMGA